MKTLPEAYLSLASLIAMQLTEAGFLASSDELKIDEDARVDPVGDAGDIRRAAGLFHTGVRVVDPRTSGTVKPRYTVERDCELELYAAGGEGRENRAQLDAALSLLAAALVANPKLNGDCERVELQGYAVDDGEADSLSYIVALTLRTQSGDPLGFSLSA